jgi:hypothetical protein
MNTEQMLLNGAIGEVRAAMNRAVLDEYACTRFRISLNALELCEVALRAQAERENPKPIDFRSLGDKKGQPVWMQMIPDDLWQSRWVLIGTAIQTESGDDIGVFVGGFGNEAALMFDEYGKKYVLYHHRPKLDHEPKEAER